MNFLIIGTGGIGGSVGGFLASNNEDVTFIARGKTLEILKNQGLKLDSGIKGELFLPKVKAFSEDDFTGASDVIFVCVKDYSLKDIIHVIKKAAHKNSIVIPLLNGLDAGDRIKKILPSICVADGCIYSSAFIASPGAIIQLGNLFKITFGVKKDVNASPEMLKKISEALNSSGINTDISDEIEIDLFKKFSMVSPCAACGAYYDIAMGEIQRNEKYKETFIQFCSEISEIGAKLNLKFDTNLIESNLKILNSMALDATSSLQKDIKAGGKSEIDSLIFNVVRLGEKLGVDTPAYKMAADKFKGVS